MTNVDTTNKMITYSSTNNPANWTSGGAINKHCGNTTTDALLVSYFAFPTVPLQANAWNTGDKVTLSTNFSHYTGASAANTGVAFHVVYNGQTLYAPQGASGALQANLSGQPNAFSWQIGAISPTLLSTAYQAINLDLAAIGIPPQTFANSVAQPVIVSVSSGPIGIQAAFSASGLGGTVTYSSGSSACTNGTQTVTFTAPAALVGATGTITVAGNVPTGTVTIANTGAGATTLTGLQGTVATCTGTAVFTGGTLVGPQGFALEQTFLNVSR